MSLTDKDSSKFIYAGWLPTVNGRLSFRHVGETRYPTESIYANVTTERSRIVLAYQRRPLSDSLFQPLTDFLLGLSGSFWFVLHGVNPKGADQGDEIVGKIYVYKTREDWRQKGETAIRSAILRLHELRFAPEASREKDIDAQCRRAVEVLEGTADISLDFHMHREGEAYFSKPRFLDSDLEYASTDYAKSYEQNFTKWIADQCYFFLRDLCHKHQHHDDAEDTIIILQDNDKEDVVWRRNIIFSLYFYIIRAKRSDEFSYLIRALGILAYCKSFKRISSRKFQQAAFDMPRFNDVALTQSIRSRIEENRWKREREEITAVNRATASVNVRMLLLTISLLVLACIAIVAPQAAQQPPLSVVSKSLVPLILPLLKILGIALVFGFTITSNVVMGWRDILELSNVYRRPAMILYLAVALVFLLLTLRMGSQPIYDLWLALKM